MQWALDDKQDYADEAREKMESGGKKGGENGSIYFNKGHQNSGEGNKELNPDGWTDRKIAESAGVSHDTVHKVTKILESGDQRLINDCQDGRAFYRLQQGKHQR